MDFLNLKLFPSNLVEAIGSTLVHSLWQGVLLAVITGLIIIFTRTSPSATRYNLLIGALVLFVAGVAITFSIVFKPSAFKVSLNRQVINVFQQVLADAHSQQVQLIAVQPTFKEVAISFINKNSNSIVLIWFVVVCARSLQLASGLNGLYYLRRKSIFAIDEQVEKRVKELASKLGIKQIVGIAQSGIAKVPMVIGHLKPLILIPVGLITTLTAEEVEAILIHELAHIRRRDYLVNMLQSLMEIVFFFNPAVLWLSALIKTERENCCDDIVVTQSGSKADYIKALVSCQEYNMAAPAYAVALTGNKNHLLTRVKRMLSNNNQSLNMMEKSLLAVCLVSAGLLTAAFSNADKINALVTKTAKVVEHIAVNITKKETGKVASEAKQNITPKIDDGLADDPDSSRTGKFKIYRVNEVKEHASLSVKNGLFTSQLYKQDGILYQLNYKDNVLSSMQVNGKNIANEHIPSYQSIIDQIQQKNNMAYARPSEAIDMTGNKQPASPEEIQKMLASIVKEKADAVKKTSVDSSRTVTPEEIQRMLATIVKEKTDAENKRKGDFDQFVAYGDEYRQHGQYQNALDFYKKAETINFLNPELEKKIVDIKRMIVGDSLLQVRRYGSYSADHRQQYAAKTYTKSPTAPYTANYAYTAAGKSEQSRKDSINRANIIGDMQKDGLIKNTDDLSFKISTKEFIVNGKKQPDDIFQKYRAKYVKVVGNGDWSWYYNFDTTNENKKEAAGGAGKDK